MASASPAGTRSTSSTVVATEVNLNDANRIVHATLNGRRIPRGFGGAEPITPEDVMLLAVSRRVLPAFAPGCHRRVTKPR
jgi:hypothetical protein